MHSNLHSQFHITLFFTLDGCEKKNCDYYSTCESDGTTEGRCVCPENCDEEKVSSSRSFLFSCCSKHRRISYLKQLLGVYTINKYNDFHFMLGQDAEAYTDSTNVQNLVTYKFIETWHLYAPRTNSLQMVLYAERTARLTPANAISAKLPARKNNT